MHIDFLQQIFEECRRADAFVFRDEVYTYDWLLQRMDDDARRLAGAIVPGSVVLLHSDFSPQAMATFLCLIDRGDIVVPIAPSSERSACEYGELADAGYAVRFSAAGECEIETTGRVAKHPLLCGLKQAGHPGLVLFSSGSSGEPKGVVHDLTRLLLKYKTRRLCYRTLALLLFDHIGGIDTALYSLSNGSCLAFLHDRSPEEVCQAIERHRVEVLPAAPTFLNLLAISGAWQRYDLSSLKIVTYGAEIMPEGTLRRCAEMFPGVKVMQKYGTSEVGTLRSKSRASDSLWVKLGGEGYETRVVNGMLEIKAESSMLGYLNAESPFTEDGWFITGDLVEVDGEYFRFLGRDSDVINVGGQKVYPAEVEGVIAELANIQEVAVFGEKNSLMGEVVCAVVRTVEVEDGKALQRRVRAACLEQLEKYKVPMKIQITNRPLSTERFKRLREAPTE